MSLIHISSSFLSSLVRRKMQKQGLPSQRDWRLSLSEPFTPMRLRGLKIPDANPLAYDSIVDRGAAQYTSAESYRSEAHKLLTYFIETFSIREDDLWVNFSAYEPDRIIPAALLPTSMGQDLLAQDILLKRLATSLIHPDTDSGHEYWARVFEQVHRTFGTTPHNIDAFPKVWMVPEKAVVYETTSPGEGKTASDLPLLHMDTPGRGAFVIKSHLAIKFAQDLVATSHNRDRYASTRPGAMEDLHKRLHDICLPIYEDLILGLIEREVNEAAQFAPMQQIYHSMILGVWFRRVYATDSRVAQYFSTNDVQLKSRIGNVAPIKSTTRIQQAGVLQDADEMAFLVHAKHLGFTLALERHSSMPDGPVPRVQLKRAAGTTWGDYVRGKLYTVPWVQLKRAAITALVAPTHAGLHLIVAGHEDERDAVEKVYNELTGDVPLPHTVPPAALIQVLVEYGVLLNDAGYHDLALHCADRTLELVPSHGRAWHIKGAALAGLDQHHEAVHCYQQALTHDPGLIRAWTNMGQRYRALHELDKAHSAFETAIAAPVCRGEEEAFRLAAYVQLGRLEEALAWGNKLLREPPANLDRVAMHQKLRDIERQLLRVSGSGSVRYEQQERGSQAAQAAHDVQATPYYAQYMELFRQGVYTMLHRQPGASPKQPRLRLLVSGGIQLSGIPLEKVLGFLIG